MAMTTLERVHKYRKTLKGQNAMQKWNVSTRGSPQRRALYQVGWLVGSGRIPRVNTLRCVDCGKRAQVYDHRDYAKPKDVEPVCRRCNYVRGPAKNK